MALHKDKRDHHKTIDITEKLAKGGSPAFPGTMSDFAKDQQRAAKSGPIRRGKRK